MMRTKLSSIALCPTMITSNGRESDIPSQRVLVIEAAIRQVRQIGCIIGIVEATAVASHEVLSPGETPEAARLQLDHTAKGASRSSEDLNALISPRTGDADNLPYHCNTNCKVSSSLVITVLPAPCRHLMTSFRSNRHAFLADVRSDALSAVASLRSCTSLHPASRLTDASPAASFPASAAWL